jgi:hypothetical protein
MMGAWTPAGQTLRNEVGSRRERQLPTAVDSIPAGR